MMAVKNKFHRKGYGPGGILEPSDVIASRESVGKRTRKGDVNKGDSVVIPVSVSTLKALTDAVVSKKNTISWYEPSGISSVPGMSRRHVKRD